MQISTRLNFKNVCLVFAVFLVIGLTNANAQLPRDNRPQPWPDGQPPKNKPNDLPDRVMESDRAAMERNSRRVNRRVEPKPAEGTTSQLTPAQKRLLSPTEADLARFDKFLKGSDTGILRLYPKGRFEYALNKKNAKELPVVMTLPITGGAAAYSFSKHNHELSDWTEIGFQDKQLLSGIAGGVLGFMTNLGDVPIDDVSLGTPSVQLLQSVESPKTRAEALQQSDRNAHGFAVGGVTFSSVLPAKSGSTYVMRSIAEGRADIVVAFRIDRQEDDGSLLILWKKLKKTSAPALK
jgi:hypothetical protein